MRSERAPGHGTGRIALLSFTALAFLSLTVRTFVADSFVIRTGSMEPSVIGRPTGGDRVLLSRLSLQLRDPRRFEVLLFNYHNNRTMRYLKRLVGLPGEQIHLRGGDLWVGPADWGGTLEEGYEAGVFRILRKSSATQTELFSRLPVLRERELSAPDINTLKRHFSFPEPALRIREGAEGLELECPATCRLSGRRQPRDILYDLAYADENTEPRPTGLGGKQLVGDLSLRLRIRPKRAQGAATLTIDDPIGNGRASARIDLTDAGHHSISWKGQELGGAELRLTPGQWHRLRLDNADDRISLFLDDELLVSATYRHPPPPEDADFASRPHGVGLELEATTLAVDSIEVCRDLHWLPEGRTHFIVPEGHYLFFGDNTASSSDSRSWRQTLLRVRATGRVLRGDEQGVIAHGRSIIGRNPYEMPDGRWAFIDLEGVEHVFESQDEYEVLGIRDTPYVPRTALQGSGVAVIAPRARAHFLR